MNYKWLIVISFILLVISLASASASDLDQTAIQDSSLSDSAIVADFVTDSSSDDSLDINDCVPESDGSVIDDEGSSADADDEGIIPADEKDIPADDGSADEGVIPMEDIDGDITDEDSIISNITNNTPKPNCNDKVISNIQESTGSFKELQQLVDSIPSGTILVLARDYKATDKTSVKISGQKGIDGNGHTIDCAGLTYAFFSSWGSITLRNLRIINGNNDGVLWHDVYYNGGAILIGGPAIYDIDNCTFLNCTADDKGGAIYNADTIILYIRNCIFRNNAADDLSGGAIYSKGPVYIENCIFEDNHACTGGAISVGADGQNSDFLSKVINCTFKNNSIKEDVGGAICCYHRLKMDKSTFISNGGRFGGAVSCVLDFDVDNSIFRSNSASPKGGAIFSKGKTSLNNCSFESNKCSGSSSYCQGGAVYSEGTLNIKKCIFQKNYAEDDGGAVYGEGSVNVDNSTFDGNSAEDYGGAVYAKEINVNSNNFFRQSLFINNKALDDNGGAIYAKGKVYAYNAIFKGNTALVDGGAIFSENANINNCTFDSNRAEGAKSTKCYGGAIRATATQLSTCIFNNNFAENHGGAVYTDTFKTDVTDCIFYSNYAKQDGGAIYINNKNSVEFSECVFENNKCGDEGGAIYLDSTSSALKLLHNYIYGNSAHDGQVVFNKGTYKEISYNWWREKIPTKSNNMLVEWKFLGSNVNHVDSNPLSIKSSCPL